MPLNLVTEPTQQGPPAAAQPPPQPNVQQVIVQRFLTAILAAFSERVTFMLNMLFTAAGLVLAWFLWARILPDPSVQQLVGVGMYSVFFLALEYVRRK